jgi:hypothetical protein
MVIKMESDIMHFGVDLFRISTSRLWLATSLQHYEVGVHCGH